MVRVKSDERYEVDGRVHASGEVGRTAKSRVAFAQPRGISYLDATEMGAISVFYDSP
jgi:hypothetical protein